jgi:hypothetical protein
MFSIGDEDIVRSFDVHSLGLGDLALKKMRLSHLISNEGYLFFNTFFFFITTGYLIFQLIESNIYWFYFLTNNGWTCLTLLSWTSLAQSLRPDLSHNKNFAGFHVALFSTASTLAWIVSFGFWTLLAQSFFVNLFANPTSNKIFTGIVPHSINLILALAVVLLSKTTLHFYDIIYPFLILIFYSIAIIVSRFVYRLAFPYPFLSVLVDQSNGLNVFNSILLVVAIFIACFLFFSVTRKMVNMRDNYFLRSTEKSIALENQ